MATPLTKPVSREITGVRLDRCPSCGARDEGGGSHRRYVLTLDPGAPGKRDGGIMLRGRGCRYGQRLSFRQFYELMHRYGYEVEAKASAKTPA